MTTRGPDIQIHEVVRRLLRPTNVHHSDLSPARADATVPGHRRGGESRPVMTQLETAPRHGGPTSRGELVERLVEHSRRARMSSNRVANPSAARTTTGDLPNLDPCASGTDEGARRLFEGVIEQAEKRLLCRVSEVLAEAESATQQIVQRSFSAAAALERSARRRMEQDIEDIEATLAVAGNRTLEEFEALRLLLMRTYETLSTLERVLREVPPAYDDDGRETEESAMPAGGVPSAGS